MSTLRTDTLQTTDNSFLINVGDLSSNSNLANPSDPSKGASLVGYKGRTVSQRLSDFVSIRDYGALGNGVADDTVAFNNACTAALAAGKGVYLPSTTSTYIIGNVNVPVNLYSDGAVLFRKTGTSGNWLTVTNHKVKISGLKIDGNWISGDGIQVDGYDDVEIFENEIRYIGGQIIHFNNADNLKIHHNKVPAATNGITNLMPVDSVLAIASQGVSICHNSLEGIAGSAIYLAGKQSSTDPLFYRSNRLIFDAVVEGNFLRNVSGHGILGQGRRVAITGNVVINVGNASGIQSIVPQGDVCTVVGNVVEGGAGVGIDMGACTNSTVVGNTVSNKGEIGIESNSCTNLTITGNTVNACGSTVTGNNSAGISVSQGFFGPTLTSFGVSVTGNVVTSGGSSGKYGISVDSNVKNVVISGNHLIAAGTIQGLFIDEASGARALVYGNITGANEENRFVTYGTGNRITNRAPSGNSDFWMSPQGSGTLRWDGNMTTMTTPANFQAKASIQIKDVSGNVFYIPLNNTPW